MQAVKTGRLHPSVKQLPERTIHRLTCDTSSSRAADVAAWVHIRQTAHHRHPWAGHDLPHDDLGWVCQQLARWLAGP